MTTATSGLDHDNHDKPAGAKRHHRLFGRQLGGAILALATVAAAAVVVVGGGTESAEAQFGATPPPSTDTLCETNHPAQSDYVGGVVIDPLDWSAGNQASFTVPLKSVDGGALSLTNGDVSEYTGLYTYSVVLDNTGDSFDPDINNHPSYHPMASNSPIVLTGGGEATAGASSIDLTLPAGCRYMMSVRAPGHDLGGSWIRIESAPEKTVDFNNVLMITNQDLPLAQVVVQAYQDYAQVNSQFDIGEPGLPGFDVVLEDGGDRAIDYFGNAICTNYLIGAGDPTKLDAADLDLAGMPTIDPDNPGGNCLTDDTGTVVIKYIPAGKYGILVIPPSGTDWVQTTTIEGTHVIDSWLMPGDTGIGGEFIGDINAASFQAFGFVSETLKPDPNIDYQYPYTPDTSASGGDITGCVYNGLFYPSPGGIETVPQDGVANLDGTKEPMTNGYVALNDVGTHDSMMGLAPTGADGCFVFKDVPAGTYQLSLFDYELLYIIGFYNVTVSPTTMAATPGVVDMGPMFIFRWFGMSSGFVFYDSGIARNGTVIDYNSVNPDPDTVESDGPKDGSTQTAANGVRDCLGQNEPGFVYREADPATCEGGIPNEPVLIRDRDGSIMKSTVTDGNGHYYIPAIWSPLFRFQVIEVGAGSLDITGHSTHDQFDNNAVHSQGNCQAAGIDFEAIYADPSLGPIPEDCQPASLGGGLLLSSIFQQGKNTEIDFGKISYLDDNAPNGVANGGTGNGGIMGSVVNTVTRVEWSAGLSAAEDDEPGIPGVTVNLFGYTDGCVDVDAVSGHVGANNADCYTTLLDSLETDSYQHPGKNRDGQACAMPQADGTSYPDINPTFVPVAENCVGSWLIGPHVKDGAWDGGFAFGGLETGHYVVEVVPPPGYQVVKENDINVNEGNAFVPAVPPSGCVGEYHYAQVDGSYDPIDAVRGSAYDAFTDSSAFIPGSEPVRLCNRRLLTVQPFRNAGVDFMLMTNGMDRTWQSNFTDPTDPVDPYSLTNQVWTSDETVPMPGRFFGLVLDDLQMTANQNALTFGEQQGVSGVPIGVYDYTGNYITTTWTDENGHYELLLPAGISINRASPRGVGPRMYSVVINDPGPNGDNWGYDPSYITNPNVLESWSGKITPADTPLLSLSSGPCSLPALTPHLFNVNQVWGNDGTLPTDYVLQGLNLAASEIYLTPQLADGTLDKGAALLANPFVTGAVSLATPDDPTSFYDKVTIDLAAMQAALAATTPILPGPYQVSFSQGTALSETPRNGITFHVLGTGYELDVHEVPAPATADEKVIQATIESFAGDGTPDLIVVPPGSYRESLVLHEGVVVQGFGPGAIIGMGTELGAIQQVELPYAFLTGTVVSPFGARLDERMYAPWEALVSTLSWGGNQGVEVGPAFQVLLPDTNSTSTDPFQIDGFGITSVRATNGAIFVNGNANGLVISNNALQANNASQGGAAIGLGTHSSVTYVAAAGNTGNFTRVDGKIIPAAGNGELTISTSVRSNANNTDVVMRDNRILQNGGTMLAGAVSIFNGNTNYKFIDNDVCGNYSSEYGGGLSHFGFSNGGIIAGNAFQNNESFDEGGAMILAGEAFFIPGDLGPGTGDVTIDSNQFLYNLSGDDGGGIMVLHPRTSAVRISNNVIADNAATDMGGGIHILDSSNMTFVHNTVANNLSTSSAEDAGGYSCNGDQRVATNAGANTCPKAGGLTTQPDSTNAATFSDPVLDNNIFWNNQAGYVVNGQVGPAGNAVQIFPGVPDMGVYEGIDELGSLGMVLIPQNSVLSEPYGSATSNVVGVDPLFALNLPLEVQGVAAPIFGQLANLNMVFPASIPIELGDFHITAGSPAIGLGLPGVAVLDIDGQLRSTSAPDAGADELGGTAPTVPTGPVVTPPVVPPGGTPPGGLVTPPGGTPPPPAGLGIPADRSLYVSTVSPADALLPAVLGNDAQLWSTIAGVSSFATALAGNGIPNDTVGAENIDALDVVSSTRFLVSFLGNDVILNDAVGGTFMVRQEDIVLYDSTTNSWSLVVNGASVGLSAGAADIDALHRLPDGSYLVSFAGPGTITVPTASGAIGFNDTDVVRMIPTPGTGVVMSATFEPFLSGASLGLGDVDGVSLINGGATMLFSVKAGQTIGALPVADVDVVACNLDPSASVGGPHSCAVTGIYFNGAAEGLDPQNDVNAVSGPLAP